MKKIDGRYVTGEPLTTLWDDLLSNNLHNEGGVDFPKGKKPEALIKRCFEIATNEGDWVLDSFLGSGTTAAVAHKMNRRWIGIEMGEQAYTHCKKRLDSVIDDTDTNGISKAVNWQGGGGYHFYELAPSLLVKNDKLPVYQINPTYTFNMLCEAICKIEGFKYKPQDVFHGHSSEKRFIHVTTEFVNAEYVRSLSQHLDEGQSLLIYATKIQSDMMLPENIEVKKIPKDLLDKCNFESEVR
ncbi:DNA methyltransferase [Bifidobacterium pseudocatenulatum]|uniref:DNA methyltransferase n=1 Tax=Bifidobacterium pseudocatenulatum TaxID=28026 RepID=UPI001C6FE27A|nr:site-specific DNA-methyltransferase [Bifidobacterium pseudocatenulatum]